MCNFEFRGVIGDKQVKVNVFRPYGGGRIQILVDNFLSGMMERNGDTWLVDIPRNSILTGDDLMIIADMIDGIERSTQNSFRHIHTSKGKQ